MMVSMVGARAAAVTLLVLACLVLVACGSATRDSRPSAPAIHCSTYRDGHRECSVVLIRDTDRRPQPFCSAGPEGRSCAWQIELTAANTRHATP